MLDLSDLERKAKAATSGPYHVQPGIYTYGADMSQWKVLEADAEYLEVVSPDVVLALIKQCRELTERFEVYKRLVSQYASQEGHDLQMIGNLKEENRVLVVRVRELEQAIGTACTRIHPGMPSERMWEVWALLQAALAPSSEPSR